MNGWEGSYCGDEEAWPWNFRAVAGMCGGTGQGRLLSRPAKPGTYFEKKGI
ncbi:MAG: hypothetical protein M0P70_00515 [Desulfobulbaceae bacterium]|nr:hypothetical protein [Desulfobulbaceae bacterium]